jgi:hypothetical protein
MFVSHRLQYGWVKYADLNVCAVAGTDDQTSVEHELHVAMRALANLLYGTRGSLTHDVPEASVPAVEMCSEMSEAGQMISAFDTL